MCNVSHLIAGDPTAGQVSRKDLGSVGELEASIDPHAKDDARSEVCRQVPHKNHTTPNQLGAVHFVLDPIELEVREYIFCLDEPESCLECILGAGASEFFAWMQVAVNDNLHGAHASIMFPNEVCFQLPDPSCASSQATLCAQSVKFSILPARNDDVSSCPACMLEMRNISHLIAGDPTAGQVSRKDLGSVATW